MDLPEPQPSEISALKKWAGVVVSWPDDADVPESWGDLVEHAVPTSVTAASTAAARSCRRRRGTANRFGACEVKGLFMVVSFAGG